MELVIFQNNNWAICRDSNIKNRIWIDSLKVVKPYGSSQSAIIREDGSVAYDWPEYLPKYIKRIVANQKYQQ